LFHKAGCAQAWRLGATWSPAMYDEFEESDGQSVASRGLADYWSIALQRRWTILLPLFLCWAIVWTISWFIPSSYTSEALILVEQQKIPEQYVVPNVTESLQDRLQSMTAQILSRTRLQTTIDRYGLYQMRGKTGKVMPTGDPVDRMRKDIKIEPVDSSSHPGQLTAFKIDYSASTPQLANEVNTELTSLFIQEDLKSQQELSQGTTAFLEGQLADAKAKLEEQEEKVRSFKARHFGDLPSQTETNVQILTGLQSQLETTQRDLDSAKQHKLYLESLLQQYQAAQSQTGLGTDNSSGPSVTAYDKELATLQQELADARARETDEHPDVIALKEKIARTEKLRKDLLADIAAHAEAEKTNKTVDPGVSAEVAHGSATPMMQVQSQLKAVALEIDNYQKHAKDLEGQIADYRARLNMTPQTEQELADVSRGYEESKANYDSLLKKQNQSQLATSLQEQQQGQQFKLLDPPSMPYKPSAPNRVMFSLGGLAAGAGLGVGLALLLELKKNVVRKQEDLEGIVPARVLVGIPHLNEPGEDRFNATFRWLEIAAVSVMAVLILVGNVYTLHKS
jgi:polysaccharide biosynthesis transport protein